jgi:sec-independent protein translocase protein TatA
MGLPNIGPLELLLVLAIALLILGPGKLPEMGSAMGRTIREFRKASTDFQEATTVTAPPPQGGGATERRAETAPRGTPNDPADDAP